MGQVQLFVESESEFLEDQPSVAENDLESKLEFSDEKEANALKSLANWKSPGPSGTPSNYKHGDPEIYYPAIKQGGKWTNGP